MDRYICSLGSVDRRDQQLVGGKAATLGELLQAGFPVPPGFCLTTAAFHLALAPNKQRIETIIEQTSLTRPMHARQAADQIAVLLADLDLPAVVADELDKAWTQIQGEHSIDDKTRYAVRSSATAEDSVEASYAGQYTSILGVQDVDSLHAAVLACWRSFYHSNALVERAKNDRLNSTEGMAVLIQPVVHAECAGVAFSVDPVAQSREAVVINACWGLGLGVVDGTVATDSYWVKRKRNQDGLERQMIAPKSEQVILDTPGHPHVSPVDEECQNAACLPSTWAERIAHFAIAAEIHLSYPQDMEWAIAEGQLWVLQSRPITALPPQLTTTPSFPVSWQSAEDRRLFWQRWDNEGWPDVLKPLELDCLNVLDGIWEEASRALGVEHKLRFLFQNGRVYERKVAIDWTDAERRVRRNALTDLRKRLHQEGRTTWDHWGPEIVMATNRLRGFDPATADGRALADHLEEALAVYRRHFGLHASMVIKPPDAYFEAYAALLASAERAGNQRDIQLPNTSEGSEGKTPACAEQPDKKESAYHFLDGGETPLTQLIDGLHALAHAARQEPAVESLVRRMPENLMANLSSIPQAQPFMTELDGLLSQYGERVGHGYGSSANMGTPTWREQPEELIKLVLPYLDNQVEPPASIRERARQSIASQIEALCDACTDEEVVSRFRRELAYACKVTSVLEFHNHYMDQMFHGQLRHAVMAAGRWFAEHQALATADEVMWLHFAEITGALRADATARFSDIVAQRRADHATWCKLDAPLFLGMPDAKLPERPPLQDDTTESQDILPNVLKGQGASPGRYRGRVRVATKVAELPDLAPGDILVAWNIGPLWTPIFPTLGGLILESGSMGQHAAATAREYGIPAIVNVQQATSRIPDGAQVTIDGEVGIIELEKS